MVNNVIDVRNPGLNIGDVLYGFTIKKIDEIKEPDLICYELEHIDTGAKFLHISKDDHENTFSVALKTVPEDSTGVAHILEHTVLCGSEKFSVRDPFFSMLKRSLSTFMNAFTSSDWTMYPFSTQNKNDFYNLMDVYLDSVFFPKIDLLSFRQEGHRLEIEDVIKETGSDKPDSSKLVYKGIVYNEMKGAMSSPDQVMVRSILNALYPDTTYRYNSGGDPAVIPTLTHEQLKAFHKRHYHPSNAFFYTYGDLPLKEHLAFISKKVLKRFNKIDPHTDVAIQPKWTREKNVQYTYPFDKNRDATSKFKVCIAWLTADIRNSFDVLALALLEHILLGNSASPLRKALIDSGLGTAMCDGIGFDSDNRETMFVAGLKDVKESNASEVRDTIFHLLEDLVGNGVDKKIIESAIHQLEFHRKEVINSPYPYGLNILLSVSATWFHGSDPVKVIKFDDDLQKIRNQLSKGHFFENLIKKYFIENQHRVFFILVPDQDKEQRETARVAEELSIIKTGMTPSEIEKVNSEAKSLKDLQENSEDISCLPTIGLDEIPGSVKIVKETESYPDIPAACYKQPTSGIFYFSSVIGSGGVEKQLIPLVPFFCRIFNKIGTSLHDYAQIARMIDSYTGGIGIASHARTRFDETGACLSYVSLAGKCLVRNIEKLFEIIYEFIDKFSFSDLKRLENLLLEYRAGLESMIVQNGHSLAIQLASRNFSTGCSLSETWSGVHQLKTIKKITDALNDDKLASLSENLTMIGKTIITPDNIKPALIGEDDAISKASPFIRSMLNGFGEQNAGQPDLKDTKDRFVLSDIDVANEFPREGWSTASAVSFVAQVFKTVRRRHADAPVLAVISKILRSMFLHREIREKGGAYGGFAMYNAEDGLFCFGSYRDPHIVSTLKVYDQAADFIRKGEYGNEDVKEAILQVCSDIDKPDTPGTAAKKAFYRKIISLSDSDRLSFKDKLLGLTRDDVIRVAEKYFDSNNSNQAVVVISDEDKLKEANKKLGGRPLTLHRI